MKSRNINNQLDQQSESILVTHGYINSNVFQNNHSCTCLEKFQQMQQKFQIIILKVQQLQSNLNLQYTKHMDSFNKIADLNKKQKQLQYLLWEIKEVIKAQNSQNNKVQTHTNKQIKFIKDDLDVINHTIKNLSNFSLHKPKLNFQVKVFDKFEKFIQQTQQKMKLLTSTVQDIGLLQRKMLQKDKQKPKALIKAYLNKNNLGSKSIDSTMIDYSKSYY